MIAAGLLGNLHAWEGEAAVAARVDCELAGGGKETGLRRSRPHNESF